MPSVASTGLIHEFHAHVYFSEATRPFAASLRAAVLGLAAGRLNVSNLADGARGPHGNPMFGVDIQAADLPEVLGFLMIHHGALPVLLHPVTGHELLDHTHHAFWLGAPQPLDLSVLR